MSKQQRAPSSKWYKNPWIFWTRVPKPESLVQCVGRGLSLTGFALVVWAVIGAMAFVFRGDAKQFLGGLVIWFCGGLAAGALYATVTYADRNSRRCSRCKKELQLVDISRGVTALGGALPDLYNGVVCGTCLRLECMKCKGRQPDVPCRWCGGTVSPAFRHLPWVDPD
jgi:hypothetical protein